MDYLKTQVRSENKKAVLDGTKKMTFIDAITGEEYEMSLMELAQASSSNNIGGIKSYRALITQSSSAAPSVLIMQDSLSVLPLTPVFARSSTGIYTITMASSFTQYKTLAKIIIADPTLGRAGIIWTSANVLTIKTISPGTLGSLGSAVLIDGGGHVTQVNVPTSIGTLPALADGILNYATLEIDVYS